MANDMNFNDFLKTCRVEDLTDSEIKLIYDAMDKNDYTEMGRDRFMDYNRMVDKVHGLKKENGNKTLTSVKLIIVKESYPPQNVYEYKFLNTNNDGCLKKIFNKLNVSK